MLYACRRVLVVDLGGHPLVELEGGVDGGHGYGVTSTKRLLITMLLDAFGA